MKNLLPTIMGTLLIVLIALIVGLRLFFQGEPSQEAPPGPPPVAIMGFLYVLWAFLEMRVSLSEPDKGKTDAEKLSSLYYAISQGLTILSALWFGPNLGVSPLTVLGFSLFIFGVGIRLYAVRTLGSYYSHLVRIQDNHRVVDTGPYRFVRHPAYAGMILAHVGILVAFPNGVTLGLLCLGLVPGIVFRILNEERTLASLPGYVAFAKTRKRLVPLVW